MTIKKNKNSLEFPCIKCENKKNCEGACVNLEKFLSQNNLTPEPPREHTIIGNVFPLPPRSIEQLAFEMFKEEQEIEENRLHILSAMYVKIQNIKHKQKKIGAIRKYFVYLCKLFDLSEIQITQILKIHRATYFRNSI